MPKINKIMVEIKRDNNLKLTPKMIEEILYDYLGSQFAVTEIPPVKSKVDVVKLSWEEAVNILSRQLSYYDRDELTPHEWEATAQDVLKLLGFTPEEKKCKSACVDCDKLDYETLNCEKGKK